MLLTVQAGADNGSLGRGQLGQAADAVAGPFHSVAFQCLAQTEENNNGGSLRVLTDGKGAHRGQSHQHIHIQALTATESRPATLGREIEAK